MATTRRLPGTWVPGDDIPETSSIQNFARQAEHRYGARVTDRTVERWIRLWGLSVAHVPGIRQRLLRTRKSFEIIDQKLADAEGDLDLSCQSVSPEAHAA